VQPKQTIVFYMGLSGLDVLCSELMRHGMPHDMPAALIQKGTTSKQKTIIGSIRNLPERVEKSGVRAPTLVIIGEVVRMHDRLRWFHTEEQGNVFSDIQPHHAQHEGKTPED